jgi:PAS domain S-box-containing protein
VGKTDFDFFGPEHAQQARADEQEMMRSGQPLIKEEKETWPDGRETYVSTAKLPLYDQTGKIIGICGISRSITARKRAEMALRESEERYRSLFERVPLGLYRTTPEGRILEANPALLEMLGYADRESLFAVNAPDIFVDPTDRERERALLNQAEMSQYATRLQRRDGRVIWARDTFRAIRDSAGKVIYHEGSLEDITERKRTGEALAEERRKLKEAASLGRFGHWEYDVGTQKITWSDAVYTLYNRDPSLGPPTAEEEAGYYPPEQTKLLRDYAARAIQSGEGFAYDLVANVPGRGRAHFSASMQPLKDDRGRIVKLFGTIQDVTERKRAEEEQERLQAQLVQAQKMESVGRLAGGVAHDFNNLLTVVSLYSQLALNSLDATHPLRHDLEEILKAGERAATLTRQLLAFSRRQVLEMRVLSLNEVLEGLSKMLPRLIGEDIAVEMNLAPDLGRTRADPGQIEQVVLNLAVNARDAMPNGGRLTLETANVTLDEAYASQHAEATPGDYVLLAVSDTGTGMTAEVKAHLFEPFFTTKGPGKGTGLGLATAYGIVKQHQGHISVYSEPGQGTAFRVYLPRAKEEAEVSVPTVKATAMPRGSETVLVAEDEWAVRGIALRVLKELGYTVLGAANGTEALRVALAQGKKFDLLLTDVIMPEMNGKALAERLTVLWPGLKVLFVSGYTDETVARQGILDEGRAFLPKPFSPEVLARKVREVLDRPDSKAANAIDG